MFKKTALGVFCAAVLASPVSLAASATYILQVGQPQRFFNPTMFTIKGVCDLETEDTQSIVHVEGIRGSGSVDGKAITAPQERDILISNGGKLSIVANSAAEVRLTNMGDHTLTARCHT